MNTEELDPKSFFQQNLNGYDSLQKPSGSKYPWHSWLLSTANTAGTWVIDLNFCYTWPKEGNKRIKELTTSTHKTIIPAWRYRSLVQNTWIIKRVSLQNKGLLYFSKVPANPGEQLEHWEILAQYVTELG